jgi:predicted Ser/Thr protein kinase
MIEADGELAHGTKIGRFVVVGKLGAGGMGVVYAAHDRELDRHVALKVLRVAAASDEERVRMLREGQAMARVTHPNVITVHEVGTEGELVFLAEELLDGGTLGDWLEHQHAQDEIIEKFVAAGRGLAAAHAAGLVHRDFKPDNVLLGKDGRVRVADFGLARALGGGDDHPGSRSAGHDPKITRVGKSSAGEPMASPMSALTRTGAVMGTPMFMAPEQHLGERADERSDQFAFCVALYHALYGDWPFAGKTTVALADAVIEGRMQRPRRYGHVPPRLRAIVQRGLATKPAARFPSMAALLGELTRPPSRRGRTLAIGAGVLALAGAAVVGGYALRTRDEVLKKPIVNPVFDPKTLTGDRGVEWLATAIERGQLDDALEKYTMAGSLAEQSGATVQASVGWSAAALLDALRGRLDDARKHLADAERGKGTDPLASAYADLAGSAVAYAGGELDTAIQRGTACAHEFEGRVPELAAMCFELHGRAAADRGDRAAARAAYADGLAMAKRADSAQRDLTLELAGAALDLDEDRLDAALRNATELQASAAQAEAPSSEAQAWVLVARVHLAKAATQAALDDLGHVAKPDAIEPIAIRLEHHIAHGHATALLGDPDGGYGEIDAARVEAEKAGYVGIVLGARFAKLDAATALGADDAAAQQKSLVADAKARGYGRIVDEATNVAQR